MGNLNRDLPTCSSLSQPPTLSRTKGSVYSQNYSVFPNHGYESNLQDILIDYLS
jgi:hypothetical protein